MAFAAALAEQPGKMIPELFTGKYDIDATYDVLDQREVVPDAICPTASGPTTGTSSSGPRPMAR